MDYDVILLNDIHRLFNRGGCSFMVLSRIDEYQ